VRRLAACTTLAVALGIGVLNWPAAFAGSERDPREYGHAKADIRSIGQRIDGRLLVHTLRTYGRWDNADLSAEGISIRLMFWTGRSARTENPDRFLGVSNESGELHAYLSARHHRSWEVAVDRPDGRSVRVFIPRKLIEGDRARDHYWWRASVSQTYAVPVPCDPPPSPTSSSSPAPSPTASASATATPGADPSGSPTPSAGPSYCGHGDVFSDDRAPNTGRRLEKLP
jgi:hypothetical protein